MSIRISGDHSHNHGGSPRPEPPLESERDFSRERLLHLFTSAPNAFFRHDVDISLSAAVKMARFAQVAGVSSTFYFDPRCAWYNIFSREGRATLTAIVGLGHRIGLHCDLEGRPGTVDDIVTEDLMLMGLKGDVTPVSFHMPDDRVLWKDFWFENAYAAEWEGRYVSDSRGVALKGEVTDDMQVGLHPEHWKL